MRFKTFGNRNDPAVLFFHAMGVTGESSEPVAQYLQNRYFCILPTSTVYCKGQKYVSKADEVRQVEEYLKSQGVERLELVVASSIGADLAMAFLIGTKLPIGHIFFDGGQFAQIGKGTRRMMTPFLYLAIKSLYWSKGGTLKKILWCDDDSIKPYFIAAGKNLTYTNLRRHILDSLEDKPFPALSEELQKHLYFEFGSIEDRIWRQAMKILVYGAGVLGCNLARNLLRAGKDVTLLARGNWAAEIKQNGLRIKDKFSLRTSVSRIPVVTELAPDAMYDVIFVVLRYTQLDSVLDTLRANRTKNIVFVGNNVQTKALAAALPEKNVLFAFALSAGHREADRVVSIDLKKITIGQLPGAISNKQLIGRIFHGTKYKVVYEPNMEDYLLCHAAFVMPAAFACYKTDGDLKKLRGDTAYLNRVLDANIEGYRAIRDAGHTILPKEDADFEGEKYRKTCLRFFKLMCATSLGKLCASDHAMNAIDEMSALNRDLRKFFDEHGAAYPVWQALEAEAGRYLQ